MARDLLHRRVQVLRFHFAVEHGPFGEHEPPRETRPVTRASFMISTLPVAISVPSTSPRTVIVARDDVAGHDGVGPDRDDVVLVPDVTLDAPLDQHVLDALDISRIAIVRPVKTHGAIVRQIRPFCGAPQSKKIASGPAAVPSERPR